MESSFFAALHILFPLLGNIQHIRMHQLFHHRTSPNLREHLKRFLPMIELHQQHKSLQTHSCFTTNNSSNIVCNNTTLNRSSCVGSSSSKNWFNHMTTRCGSKQKDDQQFQTRGSKLLHRCLMFP